MSIFGVILVRIFPDLKLAHFFPIFEKGQGRTPSPSSCAPVLYQM